MLRHLSGPTIKALLLGFFCCLGAHAKDVEAKKPKEELLSLRNVHPQSKQLLLGIRAGTSKVPPGYKIFQARVTDVKNGKKIDSEPILLSLKTIVTEEHVSHASAGQGIGSIHVRLSKIGGERLNKATKQMRLGRDRMAVVLKGECLIAPTVQAILERDFVVTGLEGKAEVESIVKALNAGPKK